MNSLIETIYLIAALIAVFAMIPQLRQLNISKQSDELNLGTWVTWSCYQLISLLYAISLKATPYIIVNVAWITFYALMVLLIIKYRKKRNFLRTGIDLLRRRVAGGLFTQ